MEKQKNKPYKKQEEKSMVVEEPFVMYGNLHIDESKQYSYADYLTWLDDKRRELINGFVHLIPGPSEIHARISYNWSLFAGIFVTKRKGKCRIYHAPFDVRLPANGITEDNKILTVVQPDVCVVCDLSKIDSRGCLGAPDLVVEIQSPSTMKFDWNDKFNLYEKAGVKEYWIVSPKLFEVAVFILQPNAKYNNGDVYEYPCKVPVSILQGLEIDLKELFEN